MTDIQKTISPVDDSVYVERTRATAQQIDATLSKAAAAQADWKRLSISERADYCSRFTDAFVAKRNPIAEEISWQMGRPISAAPGEVRGLEERARHMIALADTALADIAVDEKSGFTRFIRREPLGVVLTVAPWNYPYLTAVNSIIPALMAGNTVVLKHSAQTPLCAERFLHCFREAGLPEGVFQILHM
ncbi:MAG: aldehyde dehydrogenase family protein, partial [Candidatus Competibacteraceae bacterium]|nr:aldehyde dehydrogenase family protein [Candidatus Competibacteraceae bacterium]